MSSKPTIPVPKAPPIAGEFKRFLTKSNAIALAIGVIIGASSTAVVNSIVNDLINPVIGAVLAQIDLANVKIVLGTITKPDGTVQENAIKIGSFILVLINFSITMLVVFVLAKIFAKGVLEDKK